MSGPGYSEISAYVDGELDAEAAARVAYAAARDPAIAAQIAQLSKLKSVVPDALPNFEPPGSATNDETTSRRLSLGAISTAAAALVGVAILAGAVVTIDANRKAAPSTFLDRAIASHRTWSTEVAAMPSDRGDVRAVSVNRNSFAAPDLSAARLVLRTAEAFQHNDANVLHFGYVGTRGCRLSLFVQLRPDAVLPERPDAKGVRTAAWSKLGVGYLAVAERMDERHFDMIVAALRQYSIERAPFAKELQEQLASSREQSRPCIA